MEDVAPRRRIIQRSPTPPKQKRSPHIPHRRESKREAKNSKKKKERKRSPSSPSSSPSSSLDESSGYSSQEKQRRGHQRSYAAWKRPSKKFKEGGKNISFLTYDGTFDATNKVSKRSFNNLMLLLEMKASRNLQSYVISAAADLVAAVALIFDVVSEDYVDLCWWFLWWKLSTGGSVRCLVASWWMLADLLAWVECRRFEGQQIFDFMARHLCYVIIEGWLPKPMYLPSCASHGEVTAPHGKVARKKDDARRTHITQTIKDIVFQFWTDETRVPPNKKDVCSKRLARCSYVKHPIHLLKKPQVELYLRFKTKYADIQILQLCFESMKLFFVRKLRDRYICCCIVHVQMIFLKEAVNHMRTQSFDLHGSCCMCSCPICLHHDEVVNHGCLAYKNASMSTTLLLESILCSILAEHSFHSYQCLMGTCNACSVGNIQIYPREEVEQILE
ncbi:hypothetical protein L7F22_045787 [Adiantum nelumboides]|nr:hypothetical protein [Adiantum nelumboides]